MNEYEQLKKLCESLLSCAYEQDVFDVEFPALKVRLDQELEEIKKKNDSLYFLKVYERKLKADKNEHNLLVAFLLRMADSVNLNKGPAYTDAEMPDIDIDYLPDIRDYLKEDFVPRRYGKDKVCNIVSYNTFGIKSALIDMARVLNKDREEIMSITTRLGMKDEEGETLTFEGMEEDFGTTKNPLMLELKAYKERNEDVWDAAKRLVAGLIDWSKYKYGAPPHRKRSMSMHASGLVITGVPLSSFCPLVVPPGSRDKGLQASAWEEGLASTDLQAAGFIKFDFLSLEANAKIAQCNRLIMARHGLDSICAMPGGPNWSDTKYLNDPKSLAMANDGDLKGIFQFDSKGIRELVKKGGVTSFDDLIAYSSLYRPGPMDEGMHDEYCDRKNGRKPYEIHPLIEPILGNTYGVMCFQEQVMRILNVVGEIPLRDCEAVRKAISKKKIEKFAKYKDMFVTNGRKTLGVSEDYLLSFWAQIEAFAGYGFNLSHACAYTYISARQLWQKANYPLEFYAAALKSLKTADERIKEYIRDARKHYVTVNKLDLNKSKQDFEIVDEEIYYGMGKVKGIGEAAPRIIEMQPYQGIQDFLDRFGTEAKVMQPLIALNAFKEKDTWTLYLYYEWYKAALKRRADRRRRYEKSIERYMGRLQEMVGPDRVWEHGFDDNKMSILRGWFDDEQWKELCTLKKKYDNCVATFAKKDAEKLDTNLDTFDPLKVKLKKANKEAKSNIDIKAVLKDATKEKAEQAYYGFLWMHPLEKCPKYRGFTFEDVDLGSQGDPPGKAYPVEVEIISVEPAVSKKGNTYWKLRVEDADGRKHLVHVWEEECARFKSVLKAGNLVRLSINLPKPPFPAYSLESYPKWGKQRDMTPDPQFDSRVYVLREKERKIREVDEEMVKELLGAE